MRKKKFRVWQVHKSDCAIYNEPAYPKGKCNCGAKMIYGMYDSSPWQDNSITPVIHLDGSLVFYMDEDGGKSGLWEHECERNECDYIVLQYTGLKDMKGNEIYFQDLVSRNGRIGIVKEGDFEIFIEWLDKKGIDFSFHSFYQMGVEVIGNVWENPELLEAIW